MIIIRVIFFMYILYIILVGFWLGWSYDLKDHAPLRRNRYEMQILERVDQEFLRSQWNTNSSSLMDCNCLKYVLSIFLGEDF